VKYLACRQGSGWHIVSQSGENFGAWRDLASFTKAHKRTLAGKAEGLTTTVLGAAFVAVRCAD